MPFRMNVKKDIEKVSSLEIEIITPGHGPIYKNSKFIIDAYKDWTSLW